MTSTNHPERASGASPVQAVLQQPRIDVKSSEVHSVRLAGRDIIITLKSGEQLVLHEAGLRALDDPSFKLHFSDQDALLANLVSGVSDADAGGPALTPALNDSRAVHAPEQTELLPAQAQPDSEAALFQVQSLAACEASEPSGFWLDSAPASMPEQPGVQLAYYVQEYSFSSESQANSPMPSAMATPAPMPTSSSSAEANSPAPVTAPTSESAPAPTPTPESATATAAAPESTPTPASTLLSSSGDNLTMQLLLLGGGLLGIGAAGGGGSSDNTNPNTGSSVSSVAISNATGILNKTLNVGDVVDIVVTLSDVGNVTGTPQLALTIGAAKVQADYFSGSGTKALLFHYTIAQGQTDIDGISIDANSLSLNGGALTDSTGAAVTLTHALVADNLNYLVDTNVPGAPAIGAVATDDIINAAERDATVTVTGTNELGSTVTLNGNAVTAVDATHWSYILSAAAINAFGQGAETLTAIATDAAGNTSASTRSITVGTLSTTLPTIAAVATNDIINAAERDATVTVTGTNETGSTVKLNGSAVTAVDATHWRYNLSAAEINAFGQGAETLTAIATDAAGKTSSVTRDISVDTLAPVAATINAVTTDNRVNAAEAQGGFSISGTGEVGATVKLLLSSGTTLAAGNSAVVDGAGKWSVAIGKADVTAMGQGSQTISVTQTDGAGNPSTVSSQSISVDTLPPALPTIAAVATDNIINTAERDATVTVTGTNESGSIVTLNGNAVTVVDATHWNYILSAAAINAFGQGVETLTAIATDTAGNTSSATRLISVDILSTTLPTIAAIATNDIINAAERDATVTVTGTNETGSTVKLNGNAVTVVDATHWSYKLTVAAIDAFGQGTETLTAIATDAAGKTSSFTRDISVDTVAPALPTIAAVATDDIINTAERDATVTVTGSNESGSTVTLNGNAVTAVDATHWNYILSAAAINAFGQGAETLTAIATDAAGNTSSTMHSITVGTLSTTLPTIASVATNDIINAAERVATVTVTGTNEVGSTVKLNGKTVTVDDSTHWSYNLSAAEINAFGQGAETLTAIATDATGNTSSTTRGITVDTTAPVFDSSSFALTATPTVTGVVSLSPVGTVSAHDVVGGSNQSVTYSLAGSGADNSLFQIQILQGSNGTCDAAKISFINPENYATPSKGNTDHVYDITVRATDSAGNYVDQNVTLTMQAPPPVASKITISWDIEGNQPAGNLMFPVQVDGSQTYYYWDFNNNGAVDDVISNRNDLLDGRFNHDINGVANSYPNGVPNADGTYGTTEVFRYATVYSKNSAGVITPLHVALPTYGGPVDSNGNAITDIGLFAPGTAVGFTPNNLGSNAVNSTYDGLLSVWDAYNGVGVTSSTPGNASANGGAGGNGMPPSWPNGGYWTATPSTLATSGNAQGHIMVYPTSGGVYSFNDASPTQNVGRGLYVPLQLVDTTPSIPTLSLAHDNGISNADKLTNDGTLSLGNLAVDGKVQYSTDHGARWGNSFTPQEGANSVQVRQIDLFGAVSAPSADFRFTLDRTTVATPTLSLANDYGKSTTDNVTYDAALIFSQTAQDVVHSFTVDGGAPSSSYVPPTADGRHTVMVTDTYKAGNSASASLSFTLDQSKPSFETSATASVLKPVDGVIAASSVVDQVLAYDVNSSVYEPVHYSLVGTVDDHLFSIADGSGVAVKIAGTAVGTSSRGSISFINPESYATPHDVGADHIYNITVRASDTAGNYTDQSLAITIQPQPQTSISVFFKDPKTGDTTSAGNLIAPVTADGNQVFYHWDLNGSGTADGGDLKYHSWLNSIFTQDINGNTNPTAGVATDATYRYTYLYDSAGNALVHVALPTLGGVNYPVIQDQWNYGTAVGNSASKGDSTSASLGSNEVNKTYDGLMAIWDAYNGVGTGHGWSRNGQYVDNAYIMPGTPPDWGGGYLAANGNGALRLIDGLTITYIWGYDYSEFIALQVL